MPQQSRDEHISGLTKVAVMLLTFPDDIAREILKEFEPEEIEAIGKETNKLKFVDKETILKVQEEFERKMVKNNETINDGHVKFRELMEKAFGKERAEALLDSISTKTGMPGEFLKTCDPKVLANLLRGEHPQTIALVVSTLSTKKACDTINLLPEKLKSDVLMRMVDLGKVDRNVIEDVENVLKEQLEAINYVEGKQLGGVEAVANIINQFDRTTETVILETIEKEKPALADRIRQLMFTFEDFLHLEDKNIQVILKEISSDDLLIAMKGASDSLKEKIFSNMSERASTMLKEDMETRGPVRISDVEQAQVRIAMSAKKLEEEGKISLSRDNDQYV